jgi:multidrug efflux pump subunit AcrA (membrane-fusion protein)
MTKIIYSVLAIGVLGAGSFIGPWQYEPESVSAATVHARKILYYVDPMHPAYKSDKPGIAPDCGMQLEPVYEDSRQHSASDGTAARNIRPQASAVNISAEKQHLIGVRVSTAEQASGTEKLHLFGRVAPDETRIYHVDVGIDGFVRDISTVTTGSQVDKDQWLASFSAPEARSPIQAYLVAVDVLERARKAGDGPAQIELATAGLHQSTERLLTLGMSSLQIEEIRRTRQVPPTIRITAPAHGFALARHVSAGQKFAKGDELYRIADLSRVWILADVFGSDAEYVRPGMIAQVSLPGRTASLRARVSSLVLPQFDPVSQSVKVRLEAENPGYLLRPDMFVDVDVAITLPPTIAVPVDAVLDSGLKKTVFVESATGVFEPREVETGWRLGGRVEIVRGLAAGERIVVSGRFLLDSETRMRHQGL